MIFRGHVKSLIHHAFTRQTEAKLPYVLRKVNATVSQCSEYKYTKDGEPRSFKGSTELSDKTTTKLKDTAGWNVRSYQGFSLLRFK